MNASTDADISSRLETTAARARRLLGGTAGGSSAAESAVTRNGPPEAADEQAIAKCLLENWGPRAPSPETEEERRREAATIAEALVANAKGALLKLLGGGSLATDETIALESVLHVRGRPALRVQGAALEWEKAAGIEPWRTVLIDHETAIARVAASTAAIVVQYENGVRRVHGTAWMADGCFVVTNRHVLFPPQPNLALAKRQSDAPTVAAFRPDIAVSIDFAFDHGLERDHSYTAVDVSYVSAMDDPVDIAIIRITPRDGLALPPRLPVASDESGERLYVIGHPARTAAWIPEKVRAVFGDPDDRKRVSFGQVMQGNPGKGEFLHDASTIGGYSGGCVLPVLKSEVRGLHFYGDPVSGNRAILGSTLLAHPAGQWLGP